MRPSSPARVWIPILAVALSVAGGSSSLPAQNTGGNQGGGGGGGQGTGGGQNQQAGGILIDAEGVVRSQPNQQLSPKLLKQRRETFANKSFATELRTYSERRSVSMRSTEDECLRQLALGQEISDDVKHLAGLQRVDYLFIDPQSRDIVITGPAEGFAPDNHGRMVGLTTGRPPLHLEDLVVALNSAFNGTSAIGCSIDPDPTRLAKMGEFVRRNSNATSPGVAASRYRRMAEILGLQNVSLFGVPEDSRFANVLVEADFRMKRISLGVEPSGIRGLNSHLSLLRPNGNSIQRWWFVPYYEALYASEDRTAFQLVGQRAQLLAQEEIASLDGERSSAVFTRASTEQFAKMFTERFPELAERSAVFAELQNLFDLAVIAALLKKESLPQQVGWEMATFRDRADELVGSYAVPRQVDSESTFRRANRGLILGLVGGVTLRPDRVLNQLQAPPELALRLSGVKREALARKSAVEHPWWWD